jgi:hypothetical protein
MPRRAADQQSLRTHEPRFPRCGNRPVVGRSDVVERRGGEVAMGTVDLEDPAELLRAKKDSRHPLHADAWLAEGAGVGVEHVAEAAFAAHQHPTDAAAWHRFASARLALEEVEGHVGEEYWTSTRPAGVVLVHRDRRLWPPRLTHSIHIHYHGYPLTSVCPESVRVEQRLTDLALRAHYDLRPSKKQHILVESVFNGLVRLLAHLDAGGGRSEPDGDPFLAGETARVEQLEADATDWAKHQAQLSFIVGMLVGVAAFGLLGYGLWKWAPTPQVIERPIFFTSYVAGCIGAVFSVLLRMSRGGFTGPRNMGWHPLLLGLFRPLVGAVSGVTLYFLVRSQMLPVKVTGEALATYYVIGFLGGFSERFIQGALGHAEGQAEPEGAARDRAGTTA